MAGAGITPQIATQGITLRVVIAELQFINELANADKTDPRLKGLIEAAVKDLIAAAKKIVGEDPIIVD